MADLTITAANVIAGTGARVLYEIAGATVTAGQVVYDDPTTERASLADSNSATAAARVPKGIALNGAANGQPLAVHTSGPVTIGATLVPGTVYMLSETPGGIQPAADLAAGEYTSIIGVAISTTVLNVNILSSGVAL